MQKLTHYYYKLIMENNVKTGHTPKTVVCLLLTPAKIYTQHPHANATTLEQGQARKNVVSKAHLTAL